VDGVARLSPARGVFAAAGARLIDVTVDDEGSTPVAAGAESSGGEGVARFVTTSFQLAAGVTMSLARGYSLIEGQRRRLPGPGGGGDDYQGEYRTDTAPIPAMQGSTEHGPRACTCTSDKTLAPGDPAFGFSSLPDADGRSVTRARFLLDSTRGLAETAVSPTSSRAGFWTAHPTHPLAYQQRTAGVPRARPAASWPGS